MIPSYRKRSLLLFFVMLCLVGCQQVLPAADVPPTAVSTTPLIIATPTAVVTPTPTPEPSPTPIPPSVAEAFETLSTHLQADLPLNAPALADALRGAADDGAPTAVDIRLLAEILAVRSFDPAVITAANQLQAALASSPASADASTVTASDSWLNLLANYDRYRASFRPPALDLINYFPEADTNLRQPAYLRYQLTGKQLDEVHLLAGSYTGDGRRQLLVQAPLWPEPTYLPHGRELFSWPDGHHTEVIMWAARATALSDGTTTAFALLRHVGHVPGRHERLVRGQYNTAVGESFSAELRFNYDNGGTLTAVWRLDEAEAVPYTPQAGDQFTPDQYFLDENDQLQREAGTTTFSVTNPDNGEPLLRTAWQAVPDGNYFLGIQASHHPASASTVLTNLSVTNEASGAVDSGQFGYLDPVFGFQFPYPADWLPPQYGEHGLYSANLDGTAQLQLTLYPNTAVSRPRELQAEVLTQFGAVDFLYEQDTAVGTNPTIPGVMTAYGYRSEATNDREERTGLLVSFIYQQQGYVLDLDAPATAEPQAIALMESILRDWQFRPLEPRQFTRNWQPLTLAETGLTVPQRDDFRLQTAGAWERITANDDPRIFIALRTEPRDAPDLTDRLLHWSDIAGQGVQGYAPTEPSRLALGKRLWLQQAFSYIAGDSGEEIRGVVLISEDHGRELIVWAECPAAHYDEVYHDVLAVMLAELE